MAQPLFFRILFGLFIFMATLNPNLAWASQGPALLITDIDDTLKESNVSHPIDRIFRALQIVPVPGLRDIFDEVTRVHSSLRIEYVSRAPRELMFIRHHEFLRLNDFPNGRLHMPSAFDPPGFKLRRIREILSKANPGLVIFFGDNAEMDPLIYWQLVREFESHGFEFHTFIREEVPQKKEKFSRDQLGSTSLWFKDAMELRAELNRLDLLSRSQCRQSFRNI